MLVAILAACAGGDPDPTPPAGFPAPDARPALRGPGGPAVTFPEDALLQGCAFLAGPETDLVLNHHNLLMPYRGHLVMPWASEWGQGGLSLFEMDDPCAPVKVSDAEANLMRETHAIGFLHLPAGDPHAGDYAVVNQSRGVMIWDLTDPLAPVVASELELPDTFWPDAYARVVFAVSWQYPWLYVAAADNGLFVIDTTDPYAPALVTHAPFDPVLRAGSLFALGTELLVVSAEQTEAALLDLSIPDAPQLHLGGRFTIRSGDGEPREAYSGNLVGPYALFARKDEGAGPIVWDVSDPEAPAFVGEYHEAEGGGGYVFAHEGFLFQGSSSYAGIYDATDPTDITLVGHAHLEGDLDTASPFGNVVILSVDDEAAASGEASLVVPWRTEVDARGPLPLRVVPADGATGVTLTARIGVGFDELLEPSSVFAGSLRVSDPDGRPVPGWGSAQETIAHWVPKAPLAPDTTYTVEVMAGGITDASGNPVAETLRTTFTTAAQ